MFQMPQGDGTVTQGDSDDNPIVLPADRITLPKAEGLFKWIYHMQ